MIRPLQESDYNDWLPLWNANNLGQINDALTKRTWARLSNPSDAAMQGLAFIEAGHVIGMLHFILHPTTGNLKDVCYMQDLFVMPAHRGKGIAKALLRELEKMGIAQGWARIYWLADNTNAEAQALYRNLGVRLNFSLHVLPTGKI
ncbi:MAG TPA: GNAT family N-acetyltransferase [Alphaproteobacteria bacterium]|nr:GNAT family N-acetyltransferase [Alphaproteobacteria bacterium]